MPLNSTWDIYSFAERIMVTHWIWCLPWQTERPEWTRERSLAYLGETNYVRPDGKLVTIYTELRQVQSKLIFVLQFPVLVKTSGKAKRCVIFKSIKHNFYFRHNRWYTRNIFCCTECLISQKVSFHFLSHFPYAELPPSSVELVCSLWSAVQSTNMLTFKLFSCTSFRTSLTVATSGRVPRNTT